MKHADFAKQLQKVQGQSRAPGGQRQRRRIQSSLQDYWIQVPDFLVWQEQRRGNCKQSTYVGSSQIAEIAGERMPTRVDKATAQAEDRNMGAQLKKLLFFLSETYTVILSQDCFGKQDWMKYL